MNLSRRGFLGRATLVGLVAPAVITTPGLLMRVRSLLFPPPLTITIEQYADAYLTPAVNGLLTPSMISREVLLILESNLLAAGKVNQMFTRSFGRIGDQLRVRLPDPLPIGLTPR